MNRQQSPDAKTKKVSIIVLNWNGWRDTIECLESLKRSTYRAFNIVLIDNQSQDESVVRIVEYLSRSGVEHRNYGWPQERLPVAAFRGEVNLFTAPLNKGFCAGNNAGMRFAAELGAEYFLVLNNDTVCSPGFLGPLVQAAVSHPNAALVGGLICYADSPDKIWWAGGKFDSFLETTRVLDQKFLSELTDSAVAKTDWVSGCLTLIDRGFWERHGGFYEGFFIWSEEWDISIRAQRAGYTLLFCPSSRIYHKVGQSLGVLKPLSYYYGTRNRLLLKKMYLPAYMRILFLAWFLPTRLLRFAGFALSGRQDLIVAGLDAIRDYFAGRDGKWSRHAG